MAAHNPAFLMMVDKAKASVTEISVSELQQKQKTCPDLMIIDVREDHEVDEGKMPEAIHIGKGVIDRDIETTVPNKKTPLIFYCRSGLRSVIAAKQAQDFGYTQVYSLIGGYRAWCEANDLTPPETPFH